MGDKSAEVAVSHSFFQKTNYFIVDRLEFTATFSIVFYQSIYMYINLVYFHHVRCLQLVVVEVMEELGEMEVEEGMVPLEETQLNTLVEQMVVQEVCDNNNSLIVSAAIHCTFFPLKEMVVMEAVVVMEVMVQMEEILQ
jgi:hypothetical protein